MILTTRPGTSFWRDYVDGSQGTMDCRVRAPPVDEAMRVCPSEIPIRVLLAAARPTHSGRTQGRTIERWSNNHEARARNQPLDKEGARPDDSPVSGGSLKRGVTTTPRPKSPRQSSIGLSAQGSRRLATRASHVSR